MSWSPLHPQFCENRDNISDISFSLEPAQLLLSVVAAAVVLFWFLRDRLCGAPAGLDRARSADQAGRDTAASGGIIFVLWQGFVI